MELRRATRKEMCEDMEFGFLPNGTAPYVATDLPVLGSPALRGEVILTGAEDGETFSLYVQIRREGEVEEAWGRDFSTLSAALRMAGFLSSPLSREDLSLLSFYRGL